MFNKSAFKLKQNSWGDDHPEKIKQHVPKTIGFGQQVKRLVSPDAMLNQLFGGESREAVYPQYPKIKKEIPGQRRETLIFSFARRKEEQQIVQETKLILQKLKEQVILLEKSEKSLATEVTKIKVEQLPQKSGIYYLRFLEWLLTVVRQLRMKVEDGRAWLSTFTTRKKKRLGYWQMYKKHGTTFGLSHERTLATQTG